MMVMISVWQSAAGKLSFKRTALKWCAITIIVIIIGII